jgi:hypothetical protein
MSHKVLATWVSRHEREMWCCDFGGFGDRRDDLRHELEVSDATIRRQAPNSLLVAVNMYHAPLAPEIVGFFVQNARRTPNPIHKLAIVGLSPFRKWWAERRLHAEWPRPVRLFMDYEAAKEWLVSEQP